jgi:hypothetical protein
MEQNKVCPCCKEEKLLTDFKIKKGRPTYCRYCWNHYKKSGRKVKGLYTRDPLTNKTDLSEEHKKEVKRLANKKHSKLKREKIEAYVGDIFRNTSCHDCGVKNIIVLQFDHRDPSEKTYDISRLIQSGASLKRIQEEVSKCDIVCANCHCIRTANMFGSWRFKYIN